MKYIILFTQCINLLILSFHFFNLRLIFHSVTSVQKFFQKDIFDVLLSPICKQIKTALENHFEHHVSGEIFFAAP